MARKTVFVRLQEMLTNLQSLQANPKTTKAAIKAEIKAAKALLVEAVGALGSNRARAWDWNKIMQLITAIMAIIAQFMA